MAPAPRTVRDEKVSEALTAKFKAKTARVGIIGMGYVGLPLALSFAPTGFATTGFDIDPEKVRRLGSGESYIKHVSRQSVADEVDTQRLHATSDYARLGEMDAIVVCVPTPLDRHREPDLSFIRSTAESIATHLCRGQLVVLESTTCPRTEELVLPILEGSGLRCSVSSNTTDGQTLTAMEDSDPDFLLAFSPEREDPGNQQFRNTQVPKVIGGANGESALAAQALYRQAFEHTPSLLHAYGRNDEASGEYLPLREHCAGQ
jgi:UDP-N-acetyl-D-glucosamine dehydrogenase